MATAREMTGGPGSPEVRLERMRFEEVEAALRLPVPATAGRHSVELALDLAGATETACTETVDFA